MAKVKVYETPISLDKFLEIPNRSLGYTITNLVRSPVRFIVVSDPLLGVISFNSRARETLVSSIHSISY